MSLWYILFISNEQIMLKFKVFIEIKNTNLLWIINILKYIRGVSENLHTPRQTNEAWNNTWVRSFVILFPHHYLLDIIFFCLLKLFK